MSEFIPRVIVVGDESHFDFSTKYQIIARLEIEKSDSKISLRLDGKSIAPQDLHQLSFDYILFTNNSEYWEYQGFFTRFVPMGMIATTNFFKHYVSNVGFTAIHNVQMISSLIQQTDSKTVLDFDSYLLRSGAFDFLNDFKTCPPPPKIETILPNTQLIEPIYENVYSKIFSSFSDLELRQYDSIIFTAERSVNEWTSILNWAMISAKFIFIFIHINSPAFKAMRDIRADNINISRFATVRGEWIKIGIYPKRICRAYIVTHKKYFMPKLPDGYEWIQAGKKNSKIDLGIRGDDIGDNISELNPRIDELSVIYWVWKNTRSDFIGFSHYHRYFALPDSPQIARSKNYVPINHTHEHIMTMDEAIDLLDDCDIIAKVPAILPSSLPINEERRLDPNCGYQIFRRQVENRFSKFFPEFEIVESCQRWINYSMFFTRWKVFDAYCRWIFSFIIPAAKEYINQPYNNSSERREMGYMSERSFPTFLMRNHLRIKYIPVRDLPYESTEDKPAITI